MVSSSLMLQNVETRSHFMQNKAWQRMKTLLDMQP
jgi:hypothetical protein